MKIFLRCKVFNTSVDKFVEKEAWPKANYTILSSLKRFALFLCRLAGFYFKPEAVAIALLQRTLQKEGAA